VRRASTRFQAARYNPSRRRIPRRRGRMIPIGDSLRSRSFPFVNYAIIFINVLVFLYEITLSGSTVRVDGAAMTALDRWIYEWGTVGCRVTSSCPIGFDQVLPDAPSPWLTLITSMFIHAGWLHLLGNMLFLWIFGDNVEDAMGHFAYAVFYILV